MKREIENRFPLLGGVVPFGNAFVPVTKEELNSLESDLGERLPCDYREFLQTYGATSFGELVQFRLMQSSPMFVSEGGNAPLYEKGPLSHFYGSTTGNQSLAKRVMVYKDRMPDTMIPIADDGAGTRFALGSKVRNGARCTIGTTTTNGMSKTTWMIMANRCRQK